MVIYVTGGARSGKSKFAQELALQHSSTPVYVATARKIDQDFDARIRRHQQDRGDAWYTIEEEKYLGSLPLTGKVAVIDCVTLWISNFFFDNDEDVDASLKEIRSEIDKLTRMDSRLIFVSNEIGMGVHGGSTTTRKFIDLQGWINQYLAGKSSEAYLLVSGLPQRIK